MIFFVSTHFKHKIVCWFVWHYTTVSATSRMDHYANTLRVRSGTCQERANDKDGIGLIWNGAIGRWLLVSKQNVFSIPGQALGDFASKIKLTPVLWVLSHFWVFLEQWKMTPFCNNWVPGTSFCRIGQIHLLYPPSLAHNTVLCIFYPKNRSFWYLNDIHGSKACFSIGDPIVGKG